MSDERKRHDVWPGDLPVFLPGETLRGSKGGKLNSHADREAPPGYAVVALSAISKNTDPKQKAPPAWAFEYDSGGDADRADIADLALGAGITRVWNSDKEKQCYEWRFRGDLISQDKALTLTWRAYLPAILDDLNEFSETAAQALERVRREWKAWRVKVAAEKKAQDETAAQRLLSLAIWPIRETVLFALYGETIAALRAAEQYRETWGAMPLHEAAPFMALAGQRADPWRAVVDAIEAGDLIVHGCLNGTHKRDVIEREQWGGDLKIIETEVRGGWRRQTEFIATTTPDGDPKGALHWTNLGIEREGIRRKFSRVYESVRAPAVDDTARRHKPPTKLEQELIDAIRDLFPTGQINRSGEWEKQEAINAAVFSKRVEMTGRAVPTNNRGALGRAFAASGVIGYGKEFKPRR